MIQVLLVYDKMHSESFCYIYNVVQVNLIANSGKTRSTFKCWISYPEAQCLASSLRKRKVPGSNPIVDFHFVILGSRSSLLE